MTKNQIRFIQSLQDKKARQEHRLFLVEGEKNVAELLRSDFRIHTLFATEDFITQYGNATRDFSLVITQQDDLRRAGTLEKNTAAIAVVHQKNETDQERKNERILMLDDLRDPGNLGTIVRIADWYGIRTIIVSPTTVDIYNPKVINATKGSFLRVSVVYRDLEGFLKNTKLPVYGAFLEGENVHAFAFQKSGILLMGSESHGITPALEKYVTHKVSIPRFGGAESLNVGVATGVIVDRWIGG